MLRTKDDRSEIPPEELTSDDEEAVQSNEDGSSGFDANERPTPFEGTAAIATQQDTTEESYTSGA